MFDFLKKKNPATSTASSVTNETVTFKVDGMHCVSCSLTIDGSLEDTPGVMSANTSFAKGETKVQFDAQKIQPEQLVKLIEKEGYLVKSS